MNVSAILQDGTRKSLQFFKSTWRRYKALPTFFKVIIWALIVFDLSVLCLLVYIGPNRVTQSFYDLSQNLANLRYGWLILGLLLIILCFPPFMFYHTVVSLCGFAYGLEGFVIAGPAALIGSALAFLTLRLLFNQRLEKLTSKNEKWQALEAIINKKGLPLIILIRLSPFPPWVYSNAFFASIEAVSFLQFFTATAFVLPKTLLIVFIGSRIAMFSDGTQRGQMDPTTKILNIISLIISIAIAVLAAGTTYRLLQQQIKEMRQSNEGIDELAADALEEAEEAPLLGSL